MPPGSPTVRTLLAQARAALDATGAAGLEAELLLCHALGVERTWLFANASETVTGEQFAAFEKLLARRRRGEPIAYLVGLREFWSLPLRVTPDVLIPRPETELLVEAALAFIPPGADWRVADLGTGSGAVALAIASERPACEVHATEVSEAALAVAHGNAERLAPGRVRFHRGDWLEPLEGRFQAIVCNPPYVAEDDPHLARGDCRFEPRTALTPGGDGLAAIRHIVREAPRFLEPGGLLALEHGFDQGPACREMMREAGFEQIETLRDLAGHERVTRGVRARLIAAEAAPTSVFAAPKRKQTGVLPACWLKLPCDIWL